MYIYIYAYINEGYTKPEKGIPSIWLGNLLECQSCCHHSHLFLINPEVFFMQNGRPFRPFLSVFRFLLSKKTANPRPKTRGQFTGPNMLVGTGQVSGIIDVKLLLTQPSRRVYLHFLGVYFRPCLRRVDAAHSRQLGVLESHLLGFTDIEYSKNHWTLRIWGVWMILDVYSRGLGSPNHQLLRSHES